MADEIVGCGKPTGSVVGEAAKKPVDEKDKDIDNREEKRMTAKVGAKAPDFEAPAYLRGKFINVKLSSYLGKWVMICFYPGDFTFV